jgi:hypothetical protein
MSNGNGKAPICPVSSNEGVVSTPPAQQTIVPATDLPSALAALQQINQVMQQLKTPPALNNVAPLFNQQPSGSSGGGGTRPAWEKEVINYIPVRIHNPDDKSVYVELQRMNYLRYRERKTQVTLEWKGNFGNTDY